MKRSEFSDPFHEARPQKGFGEINDQDDPVFMVLGHKDVRKCAHDWKTFQSGATPGRIVVPSEVKIRDTRQIPFEVDPPEHSAYRSLLEAWFRRPLAAEYLAKLSQIVDAQLKEVLTKTTVEVVTDFSLPLQSKALTLLLNTPYSEAETWIAWGTHVFRSEGAPLDSDKANILYDYIEAQIEHARVNPGKDLYSVLLNTKFQGRTLTKEEVKGVMILTFAGGRDTVINAITNTLAYLAENPEALGRLQNEPSLIGKATEELIRYFSPLTHMGRVVTQDTDLCEQAVKQNTRISLCWASANRDERIFENPNEVLLDRKINPHVAFGFSHHRCLGATHARQVMKTLLSILSQKIEAIQLLDSIDNIEEWGPFRRKVGFHQLLASFTPRK